MKNNWKLSTISVVVRDMDKAVAHYESLGVGPFKPEIILDRGAHYQDLQISETGGSITAKHRSIMAPLTDSINLELLQNIEGKSFQKDFLDQHGEGVVFLTFRVEDLEKESSELVKKGLPVIFSGKRKDGSVAIFDNRKVGGMFIELFTAP